jgi:hypothetical protein
MKLKSQIPLLSAILFLAACATEAPQSTETVVDTIPKVSEVVEKSQLETEHELFRAGYADSVNQGMMTDNTFKGSSRRMATETVGGTTVSINYGSPGKRGRVIWNGLVSYDQVWVTGAHWATAVTFDKDVKIEGTEIKAGTYGFFTIPGKAEWTLILNKTYDQHLADSYAEGDDIVRFKVKPENQKKITERLTYSVESTGDKNGKITMAWDEVKVSLPFEVI